MFGAVAIRCLGVKVRYGGGGMASRHKRGLVMTHGVGCRA